MKRTKRLRAITRNGVALVVALVTLFPIFWMISTAFKPASTSRSSAAPVARG